MIPEYPYYSSKTVCQEQPITFPPQHQPRQPGLETLMVPPPISENPAYVGSGKLKDKVAILTGGDSGIGRATAIAFAKEGADLAIVYLYEHEDAQATKRRVEELGRRCLLIPGDLRQEAFCKAVIHHTLHHFGKIDILVLNQAVQYPQGQGRRTAAPNLRHQHFSTLLHDQGRASLFTVRQHDYQYCFDYGLRRCPPADRLFFHQRRGRFLYPLPGFVAR